MSIIRLQNGNGETNVHYEFDPVQKPLGEGGMGRVYRGIQIEEGGNGFRKEREVAIKCLLEDLPEHAIKRSRREASIRIKNDNLVEMIDFVESHDAYTTHYHVVSELLDGVNLDELLEGRTTNHDGKPNPTAERLLQKYRENRKAFVGEVFRSILSGIMALHDAGYIHRDIDPSNIMVTSDGKVKLIDFGIAKKVDELLSNGKSLTTPGVFVGKPHYAAPELILGDLAHQSYTTDVYALGIMLFQLVTGHLPFEGNHLEVCEKQKHEKMPLQDVQDKTVRKIIEKATQKDQKKRYQSAAEFRVDLDRWIAEVLPPPPPPIWKWVGIAAGCLAIIGIVVYLATRPPKPPKPKPIIEEQKQKIIEIKKPQKKDTKDHPFNTKNKEQGRLKVEDKLASSFFHLSLNFLSPFEMIEESNLRISNEPKQQLDDLSLGKNNISKVENLDLENVQSIYGYNQKEEKDPVKQSLLNKLEELQNTQKEIKEQFKYDKNIYLKRIKMLEKAYQAKIDENKLKNMEKSNKKNKEMIKEFKKKIELAEREKIKDREKFNEALKNVFKLKKELMEEVNELEVMIKTTSVEDYDKYMLDNPTKIEKTNFRPNDSRYLLTNEYETSRDEEESISSYDKLNHINNTPEGFEINRQNIYLNKTFNNNYSHKIGRASCRERV